MKASAIIREVLQEQDKSVIELSRDLNVSPAIIYCWLKDEKNISQRTLRLWLRDPKTPRYVRVLAQRIRVEARPSDQVLPG